MRCRVNYCVGDHTIIWHSGEDYLEARSLALRSDLIRSSPVNDEVERSDEVVAHICPIELKRMLPRQDRVFRAGCGPVNRLDSADCFALKYTNWTGFSHRLDANGLATIAGGHADALWF